MYLDNILAEKNVESCGVSYEEILMDSIKTSEAIYASEVFAMSSEFAVRTLGSEGVEDWWPKIKAFFKKLWENLKRLLAKVIAWIAALPNKIIALCKKIYVAWAKSGIEGKMKNLEKNISKGIIALDQNLTNDFNQTDWGITNLDVISESVLNVVNGINRNTGRNPAQQITGNILGADINRDKIRSFVEEASNASANAEIAEGSVKDEMKSAMDRVRDEIEKFEDKTPAKQTLSIDKLRTWYSDVKNDKYSKEFKKVSRGIEVSIEVMDKLHKDASKEFEAYYKAEDENGAKWLTLQLKAINSLTAAVVYADGYLAKLYATVAMNNAKMVMAGIKCWVPSNKATPANGSGLPKGNGDKKENGATKVHVEVPFNKPPQGATAPVTPGIGRPPKPSIEIPLGGDNPYRKGLDQFGLSVTDKQAFASDPDMIAFLEM